MQYSTKASPVPVLKIPEHDAEVERLACFNSEIHGPAAAELLRQLILVHPHARREYWPYLARPDSGEIVVPLLLGQRTVADLQQFFPDVLCSGTAAYLAEILFPWVAAFLYPSY